MASKLEISSGEFSGRYEYASMGQVRDSPLETEQIMTPKKITLFISAFVAGLFLAGCERQQISQINSDPGLFMHQEVVVAGRVTQSIGAFGRGIYQVDDGTGVIWVYSTSRGVPSKGAKVGVKGRVLPTMTFLGINYATIIQETDRRHAN